MKRWLPLAAGTGLLLAGCSESRGPTQPAVRTPSFDETHQPQGPRTHIMLPRGQSNPHRGNAGTGIQYHGGPVILSQQVATVYWGGGPDAIYIGGPAPGATSTTGSGGADGSIVGYFLSNLGGSSYFNINTTYTDGGGTHIVNAVAYTQYWAVNDPTLPLDNSAIDDATIQAKVEEGLNNGSLTYDPSTLYLVLTPSGANLGGGFGSSYCAYHGFFTDAAGRNVKYAAMPYADQFEGACTALQGSPNNDPAADAEVNVLAHEIEETTTDENLNAWYDVVGNENADKCAWQFGTPYQTGNGSLANEKIGAKDFLIQMNWVNATTGKGNKQRPVGCQQGW